MSDSQNYIQEKKMYQSENQLEECINLKTKLET